MKKTYQSPTTDFANPETPCLLNVTSPGGVETGGTPGEEYEPTDVTYSRNKAWDDAEDDGLGF